MCLHSIPTLGRGVAVFVTGCGVLQPIEYHCCHCAHEVELKCYDFWRLLDTVDNNDNVSSDTSNNDKRTSAVVVT